MNVEPSLERRLIALVEADRRFVGWLRAVRSIGLDDWCIGAGAVRDLVWNHLSGVSSSGPRDVDVAYFRAVEDAPSDEARLQRRLVAFDASVPWEVTNQATVHRWFERRFGHRVDPLRSLEEAVASWPEFATSVAVTLSVDDALRVIAPYGLDDLFAMRVRRNPVRVSVETYRQRVATKRYRERWPGVRVVPA